MKNLLALALAAVSLAAFADAATDAEEGGRLVVWPKNHGRFVFVNAQKSVDAALITRPVNILSTFFRIDISIQSGKMPEIKDVPATLEGMNAKGAIWIIDDPAYPLVLGACENGWAFLNVSRLVSDHPSREKLASRVEKMINRSFADIHGVGAPTAAPGCVMMAASGVEGIDRLICAEFSPEPMMKITDYLRVAGYKTCRSGTYYDACEQGWAPAPTNAVQKAIWDEVHKLPTKPIKILPPSKQKK